MCIERRALLLTLGLACASTSPTRDLTRVEQLARASLPTARVGRPAEAGAAPEALKLLEQPLDADRAAAVALLQNREVRAALNEVAAARGRAAQADTLPNPTFQFDLRRAEDRSLPLQADFFLEYDVTRALLTPLRRGPAQAELEAEQFRAASVAIELGYRARVACFAAQAAERKWALANRAADALAAARDAARALRRAGNVAELELGAAEAAYEEARVRAAEAELEAISRREALQRLLSLSGPSTAWRLAPELPVPEPPPESDVEARAIEASLALAEIRQRLEVLARRTGLTRAEGWIPAVKLDAHLEQDQRDRKVGGGATVSLPIFDRRQGDLAAVEAEFDALAEQYQGAAVDVRSAAREARDRLRSSFLRARHYGEVILPARRRLVQQALEQLNAMSINVFDLLRFQRELLDAEWAAADALRDYWTARAGFELVAAGGGGR